METEERLMKIEAYLEGELSEAESATFEAELGENLTLKKELETYQAAQKLLKESAGFRLKEMMQEMEKEAKVKPLAFNWIPYASVAAVILLLIASFFFFQDARLSSEELLAQHFDVYPATALRGQGKMENLFNQGMSAYQAENYQEAIRAFSEISPSSNTYMEAQFYMGNAAFSTGDYSTAKLSLQEVVESKDSRYTEAANWYLFLLNIAEKDKKGAQDQAAMLEGSSYQTRAEEIMENWEETQH